MALVPFPVFIAIFKSPSYLRACPSTIISSLTFSGYPTDFGIVQKSESMVKKNHLNY